MEVLDRKARNQKPTSHDEEELLDLLNLIHKCMAMKEEEESEECWVKRVRECLSPSNWLLDRVKVPPPPSAVIQDEKYVNCLMMNN